MLKGDKGIIDVKGDYVGVRVIMPKRLYKALKIKCVIMDISVKKAVVDIIANWVVDVKRDILKKKPKGK
ncbi:hypothetical protein ES703_62335 [subsurface metagenome]